MRFGLQLSFDDDIPETARRAESLGFEFVGAPEHLTYRKPTSHSLITLAVAAGATRSIRLLSAVMLLPLYPPLVAAKMVAHLDYASEGRLELGVGVGGDYPQEFEASGVSITSRGRRTDEALEILQRLMAEEHVTYRGRYTSFENVSLEPKPIQKPHPPIWIGGRSSAAIQRAARQGGWLPYLVSADQVRRGLSMAPGIRCGVLLGVAVDRDRRRAYDIATTETSVSYGRDFSKHIGTLLVAGDPPECLERITAYREAGVELFLAQITAPARDRVAMVDLFVTEVISRLR